MFFIMAIFYQSLLSAFFISLNNLIESLRDQYKYLNTNSITVLTEVKLGGE